MGCICSKKQKCPPVTTKYSAPEASLHREKLAQVHQQRLDSTIQHKINIQHIKMRKSMPILSNHKIERKNQEIIDGWC